MYFDAIDDCASLANLDATEHRIIQELKLQEDQDQYSLIHVSNRQTLSHSFTQSFTLYKLSGERRLRKLFFTSFIENDADREAPDLVC